MALSDMERRICQAVSRRSDLLVEDLRLHVGLPTGGNNTAALDETRGRLVERLTALGAVAETIPGDPRPDWLWGSDQGFIPPPTAICRFSGGSARSVMIAGHLDTVHNPAGSFRELTIAPDGKTATGPGCVDMKGGLVIGVAALEVLAEVGAVVSWSVLLNSDEETGSFCSARAIAEEAGQHDYGLALEPALSDGSLAIERMGSGQFRLDVRGRSAHVGRNFEQGVSAVTELARLILRVGAMAEPGAGRIVSIGPVIGGSTVNAVPDRASAWGNARFADEDGARRLGHELDALATPAEAMPRVTVRREFSRPAKPVTPEVLRLAEAARLAAEDLGQRLPFAKTGGVCDGNNMQAAGLPTIDTLGVRGGGLHTPEEWIEMASLVERCQLLAILIFRLSSGVIDAGG